MGKGGKKAKENTLDKKGRKAMQDYLNAANAELISLPEWGIGKWIDGHGEGRTGSKYTFHIGFRYMTDTGCYWTCIRSKTAEGSLPVTGTLVNWGTTPPDPRHVLAFYQNSTFPLPDPSPDAPSGSGSGGGGGGGGGGSSSSGGGGGGGGGKKTIHSDGQGGFFYYDANWEPHMCDAQGNDVYYTTNAGVRTSNPRSIKAVFGPAGATYYYHSGGRQAGCVLKSEQGTNQHFFVDAQGKYWQARYFPPGHEPAEMKKARQQQPSTSAATRPAAAAGGPALRQTGIIHSSPGGAGPNTSASHTSQRKVLVDPKTKRRYYMDSDGRAHWM